MPRAIHRQPARQHSFKRKAEGDGRRYAHQQRQWRGDDAWHRDGVAVQIPSGSPQVAIPPQRFSDPGKHLGIQ